MKLTDETIGAAMLAIAHANNMDYSIRLTKLVDDECTYTLTVADGSEPMEFASHDEASTELRRRLLRAQAIGALEAALSAAPPNADAAREVAALVREADSVAAWQAIETAPKMKTVLLFAATDQDSDGFVTNWGMGSGHWSDGHNGWVWDGRSLRQYDHQPTHWHPMPEPPAIRARGER